MYELIKQRKRKRHENYKEEKKLGRQVKRMKVDSKEKSPLDVPQFSERSSNMQFQYSPEASSAPLQKLSFKNKKTEMKENEMYTILGQVSHKASRWNNDAPAYHFHISHVSRTLYPLIYYSQSRY